MGSTILESCAVSSSSNYLGTMAGAEIGGVIGEALGWMSTSRHDGPGKAMLGSIIGTVAGAAIGNSLTKDRAYETTVVATGRRNNRYDNVASSPDYQISGGASSNYYGNTTDNHTDNRNYRPNNRNVDSYSFLTISKVSYQDEDGDGKFSRNETVNIIYEITNTSKRSVDDVVLKIESYDGDKYYAVSPATTITIDAGETIRYKAKAFCKSKPTGTVAKFTLSASSKYAGTVSTILQIKIDK